MIKSSHRRANPIAARHSQLNVTAESMSLNCTYHNGPPGDCDTGKMNARTEFTHDHRRGELEDDVWHEEDQDNDRLDKCLASSAIQDKSPVLTYRAPTVSFSSLAILRQQSAEATAIIIFSAQSHTQQ